MTENEPTDGSERVLLVGRDLEEVAHEPAIGVSRHCVRGDPPADLPSLLTLDNHGRSDVGRNRHGRREIDYPQAMKRIQLAEFKGAIVSRALSDGTPGCFLLSRQRIRSWHIIGT